jgi:hypothetical protein
MISDTELLENRTAMRDEHPGPRVGDYVIFPDDISRDGEYERQVERFSHDWGDALQTSPGGSWYLGDGYASFSGALNPSIPKSHLIDTGETRPGQFWFFKDNSPRAYNGIDVQAPCRVYRYTPVGA